jgi:hypothetical protein
MRVVGIFRKQPKQDSPGDWIQPAQMVSQPGSAGGPPGPGARPVAARLRPVNANRQGDWLRGALRLTPGSLLWEPDSGVMANPVELATATVLPAPVQSRLGQQAMVTNLQTPAGLFQLELDPVLFEMSQELVADAATQQGPANPGPWT